MPALIFKAPLNWPDGMEPTPRTLQRNDHGFAPMSVQESVNYLEEELHDWGINRATIFLDVEQPLIERLQKKVGSRTGASLHIKYQNKGYVIACDRWQNMQHNIYAIHLALRQWRSIDRWGIGNLAMLMNAFQADRLPEMENTELPAAEKPLENWMSALGLGPTATLDDTVAVYHRRAKQAAHDSDALMHLNIVMEEARAYFAGKQ